VAKFDQEQLHHVNTEVKDQLPTAQGWLLIPASIKATIAPCSPSLPIFHNFFKLIINCHQHLPNYFDSLIICMSALNSTKLFA